MELKLFTKLVMLALLLQAAGAHNSNSKQV